MIVENSIPVKPYPLKISVRNMITTGTEITVQIWCKIGLMGPSPQLVEM